MKITKGRNRNLKENERCSYLFGVKDTSPGSFSLRTGYWATYSSKTVYRILKKYYKTRSVLSQIYFKVKKIKCGIKHLIHTNSYDDLIEYFIDEELEVEYYE